MSRLHRFPLTLLALALLAGGCAGAADEVIADDAPAPEPPAAPDEDDLADEVVEDDPVQDDSDAGDDATGDAEGPDEQVEEDGPAGAEVAVFFVRSQSGEVWVEPEVRALGEPTRAVARGAMALLFGGTAADPGLSSEAPAGVEVLGADIRDRVLIVDVSDAIIERGGGSAQEVAFAEQLAHTGAQFSTVDAVQLRVEGEPVEELWGHLDWSGPIEPDPFKLSPITITEPVMGSDGASASTGEVGFRGEATVFEATVLLRLLGPDGAIVAEDVVTASEGAPGRGTWEYRHGIDAPGSYTLEASEDDPSDGEGRAPFVATRVIEVR